MVVIDNKYNSTYSDDDKCSCNNSTTSESGNTVINGIISFTANTANVIFKFVDKVFKKVAPKTHMTYKQKNNHNRLFGYSGLRVRAY